MNPIDTKILIEVIEKTTYKPNKWEKNFLVSVKNRIEDDKYLTSAQSLILQRIYRSSQSSDYQKREHI